MFQAATIQFLRDLRENNNRDWFHSQAKRYNEVKKDYRKVAGEILEAMKPVDPTLASVEVKECMFRIARDTRFSKDKTPYKTHLSVVLPCLGKKAGMGHYYLHMEEGAAFIGGGYYLPEPAALQKIRAEIDAFGEDLVAIVNKPAFKKMYGELDKDFVLVRPPKGYEASHPHIELLKLKSFTAVAPLSDDFFSKADMVQNTVAMFKVLKPLIDFLNRGLQAEEESWEL
ncbi:MAG: DUF2461 domain-containing protein [Cryomorphaceae bacterium]|nr:MAG: DUF2461 domain-containing protein [Cryomorphaceae bacterium]